MTRIIVIITLIILFNGCAVTPIIKDMVIDVSPQDLHCSSKTLDIESVQGGLESIYLFGSTRIDSISFEKALVRSLRNAALFSANEAGVSSDYSLRALILRQEAPYRPGKKIILTTVTLTVGYYLIDCRSHEVIWSKQIYSSGTAKNVSALAPLQVVPFRKAHESAVRENIKLLIKELSALNL